MKRDLERMRAAALKLMAQLGDIAANLAEAVQWLDMGPITAPNMKENALTELEGVPYSAGDMIEGLNGLIEKCQALAKKGAK